MDSWGVLHIASLHGGGVDRHVRDIARGAARPHLVWHAAEGVDVLELPAGGGYRPLDSAALAREPAILAAWLARSRVGLVHVHALSRAARARAETIARALGVPIVATLHDVLFLRRDGLDPDSDAGPDAGWLAETSPFLRAAAAVIAPSESLAELARRFVPGLEVRVVPNGSPPPANVVATARPEFAGRRHEHVVAVLGAIGPHKGSRELEEMEPLLRGSGIALVVVGYLESQAVPGWRGESLFVHGPYRDEEAAALLRAYGARIVLFPNRVPEGFGYALSDAWEAGVPALVTDAGALGERVRRHGGGWLLPPGATAAQMAAALRARFAPEGRAELARVESDLGRDPDGRVPRLDAMNRSLDALYARFGIDPAAPPDPGSAQVQRLLATSLDGSLFRAELAKLADELAQANAALDALRGWEAEARPWIAKLEGDVAELQAQVAAEVEARRAAGEEAFGLRNRVAELEPHKAAFDLLPSILRRILLKKILDARG